MPSNVCSFFTSKSLFSHTYTNIVRFIDLNFIQKFYFSSSSSLCRTPLKPTIPTTEHTSMNLFFIASSWKAVYNIGFLFHLACVNSYKYVCAQLSLYSIHTLHFRFHRSHPFTQFDWHRLLHNIGVFFSLSPLAHFIFIQSSVLFVFFLSSSSAFVLLHFTITFRISDLRRDRKKERKKKQKKKKNSPMSTKRKILLIRLK